MKFLVIDDEVIIAKSTTEILSKLYPESNIYTFTKSSKALNAMREKSIDPDIAFLDIEMRGMNGLELAKAIKDISPQTKIIFITGYPNYAINAFKVRASGYLLKPVNREELKEEIESALSDLLIIPKSKIHIKTFGNFDVLVDGKPVSFSRSKAKEILAYLVDRKGSSVTTAEIASIIWDDKVYDRSLQNATQSTISHMMQSLKQAGIAHIINKKWNSISLNCNEVECDYYEMLNMNIAVLNQYTGEYMSQYSWAEITVATLWHKFSKEFDQK